MRPEMANPKIWQSSLPDDVLITDELHRGHLLNGSPQRETRPRMADVAFDGMIHIPGGGNVWEWTRDWYAAGQLCSRRFL
jgi:hypothetical protein